MAYPVFYPVEGDTLPILFSTYDGGTGASITLTGLLASDVEIFKDGSTTQRASDAGFTLLDTDGIDFDSITGIHGFSIDLSDNTASGFYEVGPWYHVVVSSVTIDGQTVNFIAAAFRIVSATRGLAGTALPAAAADAAGGLPISDAGGLDLDAQIKTDIDAILADTNELQTDWVNGGRLDLIIDAILADTNELQGDWTNGGRLDLILDIIAADTTTDIPALLTTIDTVVDAIKVVTDALPDSGALTSLATQASVDTIDNFLDTEIAAILAAVDTEVAAIKAKTDSLTFTVANQVDANVQAINDTALTGNGASGTEWGPA